MKFVLNKSAYSYNKNDTMQLAPLTFIPLYLTNDYKCLDPAFSTNTHHQ